MKKQRRAARPASSSVESLRIESLASGGDGIAHRAGGEVVFVPRTAPGDLVEAEVNRASRPPRARVLRVIEPGPARVAPPCPVVDACGGCDWMHLDAGAQERGHAEIVRSAVARAVHGAALPAVRVHPAGAKLGYRTRARLYVKAARGKVLVGYRAAGSHAIAPVDACLVLHPSLAPVLADLRAVFAGASGDGDALVARGHGGLPVVDLDVRGELPASTWAAIDARVTRGAWAGARVTMHGAAAPASFGDPRPVMTGADGLPLVVAPGGFAQTSDEGAADLARRVADLARLDPEAPAPRSVHDGAAGGPMPRALARASHVVELFAGSGTLSVLLAKGAASFTAIELDAASVACARQNLAARDLAAKVVAADADAIPIPPRAEVVVLDPPRTGAPGASKAIAASSARVVVYVACDPPTLARDLGALTGGGLAITHLETFELFPQTSHVETVVRLVRAYRGTLS